jgi:hypothetical protein
MYHDTHLSLVASVKEWMSRYPHFHMLFTDSETLRPLNSEQIASLALGMMKSAGVDTLRYSAYSLKAAGISFLRQK